MISRLIEFLDTRELRSFDEEFIRSLWPTIMEVVRNPSSNRPAAILLATIAVTFVLLLVVAVIRLLSSTRVDEDEDYEYVLVDEEGNEIAAARSTAQEAGPDSRPVRVSHLGHHQRVLLSLVSLLLLLLAAGAASQSRGACLTCHQGIQHTAAVAGDAHRSVRCTDCHESGNALISLTIAVPARMTHVLSGIVGKESRGGFGPVPGSACRNCHESVATTVIEDSGRALRVSHKEPLEAGARCMHCHRLNDEGKVGRQTAGMNACLRCHNDAVASADCSVCHIGDVGLAAVSTVPHSPREIIAQPDCYACHESTSCDACHGVRLPHAPDYRLSHMMDAARDLWFNDGRKCYACHTAQRNSCYQLGCHMNELDFHRTEDQAFPLSHGNDPEWECGGCHVYAASLDDPCSMCHER